MDYGTQLPKYTWEELMPSERHLKTKSEHKKFKQYPKLETTDINLKVFSGMLGITNIN
jgi:hypothetical protein